MTGSEMTAVQIGISGRLDRKNADDSATGAVVLEPDATRHLRENRIVFTAARVETGAEATAALPDDDGPAGHEVPVVRLDTKPL